MGERRGEEGGSGRDSRNVEKLTRKCKNNSRILLLRNRKESQETKKARRNGGPFFEALVVENGRMV